MVQAKLQEKTDEFAIADRVYQRIKQDLGREHLAGTHTEVRNQRANGTATEVGLESESKVLGTAQSAEVTEHAVEIRNDKIVCPI